MKTCSCKYIPAFIISDDKKTVMCNDCYLPVDKEKMKLYGISLKEVVAGYGGHRRNCECEICETKRSGSNIC